LFVRGRYKAESAFVTPSAEYFLCINSSSAYSLVFTLIFTLEQCIIYQNFTLNRIGRGLLFDIIYQPLYFFANGYRFFLFFVV